MKIYHLRAAGEAAMIAALAAADQGLIGERPPPSSGAYVVPSSENHALDWGVPIVLAAPVLDPETGLVTAPGVLAPGFHANLYFGGDAAALEAALAAGGVEILAPATPQRVFA